MSTDTTTDEAGGRDLAFQATGLSKVYQTGETEVHALRGVDLAIPAGEILVLLGPLGSGKSTLFNIIGGLDRPTSGSLHYGGAELTSPPGAPNQPISTQDRKLP